VKITFSLHYNFWALERVNKPVSWLVTVSVAPFIEAMPQHFHFVDIYLEKIQDYVSEHPAFFFFLKGPGGGGL
jgi:hypothetical protein